MDSNGSLVLVATPIGNLGDISPRAAKVLAAAAIIYCEDTRHSRQLLNHLEISGKRLVSLHQHNEIQRTAAVLEELAAGKTIVLISDAGTPAISDPGQRLVAAVKDNGYTVTSVPGPSAAIMALTISGLPAERFSFEGFLPTKSAERRQRVEFLASNPETTVIYESPHRLAKFIAELAAHLDPSRRIVITRELTKLHEEVWRGTITEAIEHLTTVPPRGEYTVVLSGVVPAQVAVSDKAIQAALAAQSSLGVSGRRAIDEVATQLSIPRKRVYAVALDQQPTDPSPDNQ
jgi:16S rRNA (cytidine1402-2'-O)-methyltransferase